MLVADKTLQPNRGLPQGRLAFAGGCEHNAAHQPKRDGFRGASGFHARQHHAAGGAGIFGKPLQDIRANLRRQLVEGHIGRRLNRPLQQRLCVRPCDRDADGAVQYLAPGGVEIQKSAGDRRIRTLRSGLDQQLRHPAVTAEPGVDLLGLKQLPHDVPALRFEYASARKARRNIVRDLIGRQRREHHQAGACRILLFQFEQGLAQRQGRIAPAQLELPVA